MSPLICRAHFHQFNSCIASGKIPRWSRGPHPDSPHQDMEGKKWTAWVRGVSEQLQSFMLYIVEYSGHRGKVEAKDFFCLASYHFCVVSRWVITALEHGKFLMSRLHFYFFCQSIIQSAIALPSPLSKVGNRWSRGKQFYSTHWIPSAKSSI